MKKYSSRIFTRRKLFETSVSQFESIRQINSPCAIFLRLLFGLRICDGGFFLNGSMYVDWRRPLFGLLARSPYSIVCEQTADRCRGNKKRAVHQECLSSSSKNYSASCSIIQSVLSTTVHVPAIQSMKYVNDMARVSIVDFINFCPAVMKGGKISPYCDVRKGEKWRIKMIICNVSPP